LGVPPETRYAKSGDLRIAYQVIGNGPLDLVFVPGFVSNIDHFWDEPVIADFFRRLTSFSRLILFDKRGTGLSDRVGNIPTLEERMDDLRAVMDAARSRTAAVCGLSEGGPMAVLFAATYPERVSALVLYGAFARFSRWVMSPEHFEASLKRLDRTWGTGERSTAYAPSRASDETFRHWWARHERVAASPTAALALMRMNNDIDVRHVLPSVRVPTLVLHRADDLIIPVEAGRDLGRHIPGARYVELPGRDHFPWAGDTTRLADEIEEFLTGERSAVDLDRVLATVLFTDIVNSTTQARALGDRAWRDILEQHHRIVRREIARFRGREVKSLGDGFLVTFDGPARAIRCALAVQDGVRALGIQVRSGLHTGEIEVTDGDVSGIAVHIASRVADLAQAGEVIVSATVRDLVAGSNIVFGEGRSHAVKGLSEELRVFRVEEGAPASHAGVSLPATSPR
jgi:class 3 adenylate cyclase